MSPTRARSRKVKPDSTVPAVPKEYPIHHLVPPHELLTEEESREALQRLRTSVERLPKILVSDPALRTDPKFRQALESKASLSGRLIRIRRPSPTAGEAVAYRLLVSSPGD
ncbi:MAG TPA: DNA-directed RNA polymerase subunit RpoH/Rpb5 C-terminal domain-containing protein [Thermoplasmata archaeon]|nr:DNA-directed RNA polymerase subunit RpoH/Rpb5 C-terminal domain-containing protein [Thermoplasmata archaeon]